MRTFTVFFILLSILVINKVVHAADANPQALLEAKQKAQEEKLRNEIERIVMMNKMGRIRTARLLNDLTIVFGQSQQTTACYQAAMSSVVEDTWNYFVKQNGCLSSDKLCAPGPNTEYFVYIGPPPDKIYELNKKIFERDYPNLDYSSLLLEKVNDMVVTNSFMNYYASVYPWFDPNQVLILDNVDYGKSSVGGIPVGAADRINRIDQYLVSCGNLKQQPWSVVGGPDSAFYSAQQKMSVYYALALRVYASSLPDNQKTIAGCLSTLLGAKTDIMNCAPNQACPEKVPQDNEAQLRAELNELMQHHCSALYARQMNERNLR